MLSYPVSWLPVVFIVAVLVSLSAYLALIVFAVIGLLTLALVVGVIALAATELYALVRRLTKAVSGRDHPAGVTTELGRGHGTAAR